MPSNEVIIVSKIGAGGSVLLLSHCKPKSTETDDERAIVVTNPYFTWLDRKEGWEEEDASTADGVYDFLLDSGSTENINNGKHLAKDFVNIELDQENARCLVLSSMR